MNSFKTTTLLIFSLVCLVSCKPKEDDNKIEILKAAQNELINQCKIQENQLRIKTQGNPSSEIYFSISQKLNSYIFKTIDTMCNKESMYDLNAIQSEYFDILSNEEKKHKYKLFLPQDDSIIHQLKFNSLKQSPSINTESILMHNISILTNHLKILKTNGIGASFGCNLGIRQLGYGSISIYENNDSTELFFQYDFPWKKTIIKEKKFIRLENDKAFFECKQKKLEANKIKISTKKLKKGNYLLKMQFKLIIEDGNETTENINFPFEIYK